jgi:23S rRNA pseudouridine2605 synthase
MRLNRYIANATGMSRRKADEAISAGRVSIDGRTATVGDITAPDTEVRLDDVLLKPPEQHQVVLLNKPVGYVCSRKGQGSRTIYDLLPIKLNNLKAVGRLDKDSSGLIIVTDDGDLAQRLTHPSHQKEKVYLVALDKDLTDADRRRIQDIGVRLEDGMSRFEIGPTDVKDYHWEIVMKEGRNRQIRRTFGALGYQVVRLHRIRFGPYVLPDGLKDGGFLLT